MNETMFKPSLEVFKDMFDKIAVNLSPSAVVIILYIFRKTVIEGKLTAKISLIDFTDQTQMTRPTVIKHINELVDLEYLSKDPNTSPHSYWLGKEILSLQNIFGDLGEKTFTGPVLEPNVDKVKRNIFAGINQEPTNPSSQITEPKKIIFTTDLDCQRR